MSLKNPIRRVRPAKTGVHAPLGDLELSIAGFSNAQLDQVAGMADIRIAGSGDVEIGNAVMPTLKIDVRGSGYPIRAPMVDLVEVGAGGGSIAWIDPAGGLQVGPRSAGASPGRSEPYPPRR